FLKHTSFLLQRNKKGCLGSYESYFEGKWDGSLFATRPPFKQIRNHCDYTGQAFGAVHPFPLMVIGDFPSLSPLHTSPPLRQSIRRQQHKLNDMLYYKHFARSAQNENYWEICIQALNGLKYRAYAEESRFAG
ncbi:MAG: hypothetical protein JXA78_18820, partial [Anaerolineales bacterium]|nr:hypothetical protein [Anaerolineales bacterium]